MAAKVRQLQGAWWVVTHHLGKRQHKRIGKTRADKRQAEEIAKQINAAIALGHFSTQAGRPASPECIRFDDFAQMWLERELLLPLERGYDDAPAEKTVRLAESHIRLRLNPVLSGRNVREMNRGDVQQAYDWCLTREPHWSPRTIEMTISTLGQVFAYAEAQELVKTNPVAAWRRTRGRRRNSGTRPVGRENVLDSEELSQLLETTRKNAPEWYSFIGFLADTGVRLGEASALLWIDVDLIAQTARIHRSFSDGKTLSATKTGRERRIELSSRVTEVLRESRPDIVGSESLVFPNRTGGFIDPHNFRARAFRRIVSSALGPDRNFSPHGLRHTFASLHLARGTNLKWIQAMGGWASAKLLLDLYGHFLPTETTGFADALDGTKRQYAAPNRDDLTDPSRRAPKRRALPRSSVAPRAGLEPATRCLEGSRSIQLSYRGVGGKVQEIRRFAAVSENMIRHRGSPDFTFRGDLVAGLISSTARKRHGAVRETARWVPPKGPRNPATSRHRRTTFPDGKGFGCAAVPCPFPPLPGR